MHRETRLITPRANEAHRRASPALLLLFVLFMPIGVKAQIAVSASSVQRLEAAGTADFGRAVAVDGAHLVAASESAVHPYERDPDGTWRALATIDGGALEVALDGDRLVTLTGNLVGTTNQAHFYVFDASADAWTLEQSLDVPGAIAIDISGDFAIAGAPELNDPSGTSPYNEGAFYLLVRNAGVWYRCAPSFAFEGNTDFGVAVSVSGSRIAVGARYANAYRGRVSIYDLTPGSCTVSFIPKRFSGTPGGTYEHFGSAVALEGDVLAVGCPSHGEFATDRGAAHVFHFVGGEWVEVAVLTGERHYGDAGASVATDGSRVIYGEHATDPRTEGVRTVHVAEELSDGSFVHGDFVSPEAPQSDGYDDVAIDADLFVVGSRDDGPFVDGDRVGHVYVYSGLGRAVAPGWPCADATECSTGICSAGVFCRTDCGNDENDCQVCNGSGVCEVLPWYSVCRPSRRSCDPEEQCLGAPGDLACPADVNMCEPDAGADASVSRDAGIRDDAGRREDAGSTAQDASTSTDAGTAPIDGGCGCRIAARPRSLTFVTLLAIACLWSARRRR